jgi:biotin operon repressor
MTSTDPYRLLAGRLGYPDSPYLRKILEYLIPEGRTAEIVVEQPTPAEEIASKFQMTEEEVNKLMEAMHNKGIVTPSSRGYFFVRSLKDLQDTTKYKGDSEFQRTLDSLWREFFEKHEKKELTFSGLVIGDQLGPIDWTVTPEEAERVMRAYGTVSPWYWKERPSQIRMAPATLGSKLYYALLSTKYDLTGPQHATGLHLSQEDEFFGPLQVGATYKVRGKVADKKSGKGRNYATIAVEVTNAKGNLVARYQSTVEIPIN